MEGTRPWSRRAAAGSVGASQPTWWTCGHKEGWGGQPRRPATVTAAPQGNTNRGSIQGRLALGATPEAAWCRAALGARLGWTPTSSHGEMVLRWREEPSVGRLLWGAGPSLGSGLRETTR